MTFTRLLMAALLCWAPGLSAAEPLTEGSLTLSGAWLRALPPTQTMTAGYLTVSNSGPEAVIIVGASQALAERVEIHHSREVDGLTRMERLPQLELAAGESVQLAPGGIHLMLMGLSRMPAPGEEQPLCLQTAAGQSVCTQADVRKGAAQSGQHHHHDQH